MPRRLWRARGLERSRLRRVACLLAGRWQDLIPVHLHCVKERDILPDDRNLEHSGWKSVRVSGVGASGRQSRPVVEPSPGVPPRSLRPAARARRSIRARRRPQRSATTCGDPPTSVRPLLRGPRVVVGGLGGRARRVEGVVVAGRWRWALRPSFFRAVMLMPWYSGVEPSMLPPPSAQC